MQIEIETVERCPICAVGTRHYLFAGREHEYDNTTDREFGFYRCDGCNNVYIDPRPGKESLSIIYPPNYYSRAAGINAAPEVDLSTLLGRILHRMAVGRISENLAPHLQLGPGSRYLDVGCGSGRHLRSIQIATGCQAEGIDFDVRDELVRKYHEPPLILHRGEFATYDFGDARYDVVYAAHIVEHLADPVGFLRKIEDILKPGGLCVLETPNTDCVGFRVFSRFWGGNHIPRHWFLLDDRSARKLVERASPNVTLLRIRYIPITFTIWTCHALLDGAGLRWLADALFPSDHRYVSPSPVNLARHGIAYALSAVEKVLTGRSACMVMVIRKN